MKKTLLFLLTLCLLISVASCAKDGTIEDDEPLSVASDTSAIVSHGWVAENALPQNTALADWYAASSARQIVNNALICSRDDNDGLWHCWLYLGAWEEGDTLSFGADSTDGYTVVISHIAYAEDDGDNSTGVFYFTVDSPAELDFDLYVNNDSEGMIVTHSDVSVKKAQ
ncbi:MAG: hypothetical protein IJW55_05565 [Clostridia bacterium]|nr:hypothetical protein [Clostridia bacterium]